MTGREKRLAIAAGSVAAIFFFLVAFDRFVGKPLKEAERKTQLLLSGLDNLRKRERLAAKDRVDLVKIAERTYGDEPDQASARAGERLTEQIERAGLEDARFTRLPMSTPKSKRRGLKEISWSVQGTGPLENIVNFLYVLDVDPFVQRIENVVISPKNATGQVAVNFRFLTVVLDPIVGVERLTPPLDDVLNAPGRRVYDSVGRRDLFRPYVRRPEAPPLPPAAAVPAGPGPESYRVVSLSQWQGRSEILVFDREKNKTVRYVRGDQLAGGVIAMVDYRALPAHRNAELKSFSRVIISADNTYWAIDSGDTFADKYQLPAKQLPRELTQPQ